MSSVKRLGHVVRYSEDPKRISEFYRDVLGMEIVDTDRDYNLTFLKSKDANNHDLSFTKIQKMPHIAFEVESLSVLQERYRRIRDLGMRVISTQNFGWSISFTFEDPDGNLTELYWPTGRHFPHREPIDIEQSEAKINAILDEIEQRKPA